MFALECGYFAGLFQDNVIYNPILHMKNIALAKNKQKSISLEMNFRASNTTVQLQTVDLFKTSSFYQFCVSLCKAVYYNENELLL